MGTLVHSMLVLSSSPHAYFLQEVALSDTGSFAGGAPDSPPGGAGRGGGGGGMERGQYGGNWAAGQGRAIWRESIFMKNCAL